MSEITVWVNAFPEDAGFGDTVITIKEDDADRAEFLEQCEAFFKARDRAAEADRFHQAIMQTPSD
jgi:hypothetical protein